MKRLVFNAVFCFLFIIPIFIFVATPAMAIVEIGVTGTFTDDDPNTTATNERQIVVKLEYSHVPFPKPTIGDLTLDSDTSVTLSETDNAGFNILRSHRKEGEYKQINSELIQGAGITGERNTYKWVDPTEKPGVVYYYQKEFYIKTFQLMDVDQLHNKLPNRMSNSFLLYYLSKAAGTDLVPFFIAFSTHFENPKKLLVSYSHLIYIIYL